MRVLKFLLIYVVRPVGLLIVSGGNASISFRHGEIYQPDVIEITSIHAASEHVDENERRCWKGASECPPSTPFSRFTSLPEALLEEIFHSP